MELRLLRRPNLANLVEFVRGGRLGETTTRCEGSRGHDREISMRVAWPAASRGQT